MTLDPRIATTEFIVEVTRFEQLKLWEDNRRHPHSLPWHEESIGVMVEVANFAGFSVNISLCWAVINGRRVCFWEPISRVVDIELIDRWFREHCKAVKEKTNAMNFHNVRHQCETTPR